MTRNKTPDRLQQDRAVVGADRARQDRAVVTAGEWFGGGQRIWYDPDSARVLTEEEAAAVPGALRVFERVAAAEQGADAVWLTLLPGFPDGSYGWAQVDRLLGNDPRPRLYVEPVGQGDSDKPRHYRYSSMERADLVLAVLDREHQRRVLGRQPREHHAPGADQGRRRVRPGRAGRGRGLAELFPHE